ncbi:hypothetical protein CW751_03180 [Brumimicrobium salinarum]|uniref:Uncharacterized protein n=1 Tax=Brumimicrobium salinarum TaxID=2058658 RepID=A0A2I0R4M7_9FLAO|nr:hypothetical protein [Brumimicrobium salinarum]PKR81542.1 hypothetical protein CW751_03180 [Brumimicrobium salinarum]
MNRPIGILSLLSVIVLLILALLMIFGVINFISNFKFVSILAVGFITFFSLAWLVKRNELSKPIFVLLLLIILAPLFLPIIGLFNPDWLIEHWNFLSGGIIFQLGTGVFALMGGFIKKGMPKAQHLLGIINYLLFIFLSVILIFEVQTLLKPMLFYVCGGFISVLSILLIFIKRPTISL